MAHGESPRHSRKRPAAGSKRAAESPKKTGEASRKASSKESKASKADDLEFSSGPGGAMRLQKLLASAGFGSRRDVERFLEEERVTVNGRVATIGDRANPAVDHIRFDGERLKTERPAYWIVNKPRGVVTTVRDEEGRRTVLDLMPPSVERVFPVGRLDRETSGLLLMTNDGDLAFTLLHPSLGNEREYRVNVKGRVDDKAITRLKKGVNLEEGRMAPAQVSDIRYDPDAETSSLTLTLIEGKKRQIRRSLLFLGFPVRRLVRVRMGPLRLGRLKVGEARVLRSEEKRELFEHVRRLRAGEPPKRIAAPNPTGAQDGVPKARSTRNPRPPRSVAGSKGPVGSPRAKSLRGTRGGAPTARVKRTSSAPNESRRPPTGPAALSREPAASRTGNKARPGAAARPGSRTRPGNKARPSDTARPTNHARPAKPAGRRPSNPTKSTRKPTTRKPAKSGGQRTARSKKGTRK